MGEHVGITAGDARDSCVVMVRDEVARGTRVPDEVRQGEILHDDMRPGAPGLQVAGAQQSVRERGPARGGLLAAASGADPLLDSFAGGAFAGSGASPPEGSSGWIPTEIQRAVATAALCSSRNSDTVSRNWRVP